MASLNLYYARLSPPCRTVMLTAKALGLNINYKTIDFDKNEHMKPEFLAINPEHCVPTLVDGDLNIWESRAIVTYLANQYAKDDSFYPKDPKKRVLVDRMLYFDLGTLYSKFATYAYPLAFGEGPIVPGSRDTFIDTLGLLNGYLTGKDYITGPNITIADHSLGASVSSFAASGIDLSGHPNIVAWLARCAANMPGWDENEAGAQELGAIAKPKLTSS